MRKPYGAIPLSSRTIGWEKQAIVFTELQRPGLWEAERGNRSVGIESRQTDGTIRWYTFFRVKDSGETFDRRDYDSLDEAILNGYKSLISSN